MTRIELAAPVGVGAFFGLAAGVVTGQMAGIAGVVVGVSVGACVGAIAGIAMHRDEGRKAARSRELDEIIGVAGGELGAAPVSIPDVQAEEDSALELSAPDKARWLAEWLTPPPPVVQ